MLPCHVRRVWETGIIACVQVEVDRLTLLRVLAHLHTKAH